jgi:hypothetical protein
MTRALVASHATAAPNAPSRIPISITTSGYIADYFAS